MTPDDDDYRVGYGKPPVTTRFKEGSSGNPKGRPKSNKPSWAKVLPASFDEKVTVFLRGRLQKLSHKELIVERLIDESLKGNKKAIQKLFSLRAFANKHHELEPKTITISGKDADL